MESSRIRPTPGQGPTYGLSDEVWLRSQDLLARARFLTWMKVIFWRFWARTPKIWKILKFFFKNLKHPWVPSKWWYKFGSAGIFGENIPIWKIRPFWASGGGPKLKMAVSRPKKHLAQKFRCRASSSAHEVPSGHSDGKKWISHNPSFK